MKQFMKFFLVIIGLSGLLIACSKDDNSTTLRVRMTDAPAAFDEVNVDLEEVMVKYRDGGDSLSGWTTLSTVAGVYDLLGLTAGVDTLIASGVIPSNSVKEIRLVLGSDNTIVVGGTSFPLTIPSGAESGLKIKVNKNLSGPLDSLLIDFDAALSVHQTGTGEYILQPVLKIK